MTPTIYFVRHGETDWNAKGGSGAAGYSLERTGQGAGRGGRRQARIVLDYAGLDYVASPMHRTRETMERLREAIFWTPRTTASTSASWNSPSAGGRA